MKKSFFKKGELKILWPFYLDLALSRILQFAPAFLIPYFLFIGLSATKIGILIATMSLFGLLFEIPTGAIADLYGRKKSVLIGYFLEGLGFLSIFFFSNFYFLMASFAFIGFGKTFSSGSKEAWITDLIGKKKNLLHEYFVKEQTFENLGLLLSGFLGVLVVVNFGLASIWIFSTISFAISISILLFSSEVYSSQKSHVRSSYSQLVRQTKKSIKYSRKHNVLFYFFLANFILVFGFLFNEGLTWTPFLLSLGFPNYAFGYLWSALGAVYIVSPWLSKLFLKKNKERRFIITVILLSMIVTSLVVFVNSLWAAISIILFSLFFYGSRRPVERIYFHKFIPSKLRATVGSVESMVLGFAVIIATPLVGLAVDTIGPRNSILLSVIIMIPGIIVYSIIKEERFR